MKSGDLRLVRGGGRAAALLTICAALSTARAQDVLLPTTSWGFVPVVAGWHFNTPINGVADVAQVAVPFKVRFGLGHAWSMDITGAYATSAVYTTKGDSSSSSSGSSSGNDKSVLLLSGPTDLKLRVSGPIKGDALQMTFGLNIPT